MYPNYITNLGVLPGNLLKYMYPFHRPCLYKDVIVSMTMSLSMISS